MSASEPSYFTVATSAANECFYNHGYILCNKLYDVDDLVNEATSIFVSVHVIQPITSSNTVSSWQLKRLLQSRDRRMGETLNKCWRIQLIALLHNVVQVKITA
jgi:hypothetical protein